MAQKKTFKGALQAEKEAAAAAFLSQAGKASDQDPDHGEPEPLFAPQKKGEKKKDDPRQRKTERLNLTISPQDKEDLHIMSYIERKAAGRILIDLLEGYLASNRAKIQQYKELFGTADNAD